VRLRTVAIGGRCLRVSTKAMGYTGRLIRLLGFLFLIVGVVGFALMVAGAAAATNVVSIDLLTTGPIPRLLAVLGSLLAIISPAFLVVGGGLVRRAPWARPLAFAVAVICIFSFPVGTFLALAAVAVLGRSDAKQLFEPAAPAQVDRLPAVEPSAARQPPAAVPPAIASVAYDISLDDLVAFAEYHTAHSPAARSSYYWSLGIGAIVVVALVWALGFRGPAGWAGAAAALVGWPLYLDWRTRSRNRRFYRRVYSESANHGMLGRYRASADADGLTVATAVTDARTRWSGVDRIEEAPGLAFIYVGSMNAYTVPEGRVVEGNFREFVATARRLHADARGRPS
jgi:hypothetical protein